MKEPKNNAEKKCCCARSTWGTDFFRWGVLSNSFKALRHAASPKTVISSFYGSCREIGCVNLRFFRFPKKADIREQRTAIKFCFLLVRSAVNAVVMLSIAYKEHSLKKKSSTFRVIFAI